jgi:hypothetical protein
MNRIVAIARNTSHLICRTHLFRREGNRILFRSAHLQRFGMSVWIYRFSRKSEIRTQTSSEPESSLVSSCTAITFELRVPIQLLHVLRIFAPIRCDFHEQP